MGRSLRFGIPRHKLRLGALMETEYPGFRLWFLARMGKVEEKHGELLTTEAFRKFLRGAQRLPDLAHTKQAISDELARHFLTYYADSALGLHMFDWMKRERDVEDFASVSELFRQNQFLPQGLLWEYLLAGRSFHPNSAYLPAENGVRVGYWTVSEMTSMLRALQGYFGTIKGLLAQFEAGKIDLTKTGIESLGFVWEVLLMALEDDNDLVFVQE